jgi:hypothetical protein
MRSQFDSSIHGLQMERKQKLREREKRSCSNAAEQFHVTQAKMHAKLVSLTQEIVTTQNQLSAHQQKYGVWSDDSGVRISPTEKVAEDSAQTQLTIVRESRERCSIL